MLRLHLIYHTPPDSFLGRLPLVHVLRTHHRVHHHQPLMRSHNFNITSAAKPKPKQTRAARHRHGEIWGREETWPSDEAS